MLTQLLDVFHQRPRPHHLCGRKPEARPHRPSVRRPAAISHQQQQRRLWRWDNSRLVHKRPGSDGAGSCKPAYNKALPAHTAATATDRGRPVPGYCCLDNHHCSECRGGGGGKSDIWVRITVFGTPNIRMFHLSVKLAQMRVHDCCHALRTFLYHLGQRSEMK